jgi:hypothetical protein
MKTKIKFFLRRFFPSLYCFLILLRLYINRASYFHITGFWQTAKTGKPVNCVGEPIPFVNFSFLDFLKNRLSNKFVVFEYGSGNSTIYYANKVKNIVSVEHDNSWIKYLQSKLPKNSQVIYADQGDIKNYCYKSIRKKPSIKFNIVIIDGRNRVECVKACIPMLKRDGVIILDDSERAKYKKAFSLLKKHGFKNLSFIGLKGDSIHSSQTTIFYRKNNCLKI